MCCSSSDINSLNCSSLIQWMTWSFNICSVPRLVHRSERDQGLLLCLSWSPNGYNISEYMWSTVIFVLGSVSIPQIDLILSKYQTVIFPLRCLFHFIIISKFLALNGISRFSWMSTLVQAALLLKPEIHHMNLNLKFFKYNNASFTTFENLNLIAGYPKAQDIVIFV